MLAPCGEHLLKVGFHGGWIRCRCGLADLFASACIDYITGVCMYILPQRVSSVCREQEE